MALTGLYQTEVLYIKDILETLAQYRTPEFANLIISSNHVFPASTRTTVRDKFKTNLLRLVSEMATALLTINLSPPTTTQNE